MHPSKRKGDQAERVAAALINDLTGWPTRRKLGAGRLDDIGDIDGVPDTVIQVTALVNVTHAFAKLEACVEQQQRAGATFGATFLRRPGGKWVVVLTPEQWATYAREAS